jgi:hypothetical protein
VRRLAIPELLLNGKPQTDVGVHRTSLISSNDEISRSQGSKNWSTSVKRRHLPASAAHDSSWPRNAPPGHALSAERQPGGVRLRCCFARRGAAAVSRLA